ncbi:MAG: hypothetical protein ABI978_00120 [Chloroflexota bacterium]
MKHMRHPTLLGGFVLGTLLLSACAHVAPGVIYSMTPSVGAASPTETPPASGPLILAFDAVDQTTAWIVTDQALLATTDGGQSWKAVAGADVAGVRALLVLGTQHLVLASLGGADSLDAVVRTSLDGGLRWQESRLQTHGQPGDVRLAASDTLLVAQVVQTTSSNFSQADLFVSRQGGVFERRPAPAAGMVSITGADALWLAGGVLGERLWRSADAGLTWSEVRLPFPAGLEIGVSAPQRVADRLLLPVTIDGPATQEAWLTSTDDGATWRQVTLVAVGGDSGPGALPMSRAGDRVVVASPAGGLFAVTAAGRSLAPISPNGLPLGGIRLRFTSASAGWAVVTQNGCLSGKSQCFEIDRLFSTIDGGQTWEEAQVPG